MKKNLRLCLGVRISVLAGICCYLIAGFATMARASSETNVVVTLKPVHALVTQIMDGVGTPVLIVDGAASPHTFSLKPSAARAIQNADVFVRVSERVELFTHKIVEALPKSVTVVTLAEQPGMILLDQRKGGTFEAHQHHGHEDHDDDDDGDDHSEASNQQSDGHDDHGKDGHIWLSPENAKAIVRAVTKTLVARYPDHADRLTKNAEIIVGKIDDLSTELLAELVPVRKKPFIVFHDATQYFENAFGLTASGSITVSPDVQPSAKRLAEVRKKISELGAVCVFAEPNFQPKLIAAVTEGTNARSGTIDAEAQSLRPGPQLYFEMMRALSNNFIDCLK